MRARTWTVIENPKDTVADERSFAGEQWMTLAELHNATGAKGILDVIDWNQVPELANLEQALETPTTRLVWGWSLLQLFPCFQGRVKADMQRSAC